jgi:hypothetical protein
VTARTIRSPFQKHEIPSAYLATFGGNSGEH